MSAATVRQYVEHNSASMAGSSERGRWGLPPAKHWPGCTVCGIHGAARARKGIKRGTNAARRRHDKDVIRDELHGVR